MVRRPPFGFFVLAFEIYAFIAAAAAYNNHFIAPISLIFFAFDHTEFLILIAAILCGVDLYLKPTCARWVIFAIALLPVAGVILAIIAHALSPGSPADVLHGPE
jgi:predicted membrane channel-forming protein YqfA (hemolysin III family)